MHAFGPSAQPVPLCSQHIHASAELYSSILHSFCAKRGFGRIPGFFLITNNSLKRQAVTASQRQCVRAAKEMDSKSIGLCPQGVESPRCRSPGGQQGSRPQPRMLHGTSLHAETESCPYASLGSIPGAPACSFKQPRQIVVPARHSWSKVPS